MKSLCILLIMLLIGCENGFAQSDSLSQSKPKKDTLASRNATTVNGRANRAALKSAMLPGLGQVSNAQVWKVPIVYAALGTTVYFALQNNKEYKRYRQAYRYRNDGNPNTIDEFDPVHNPLSALTSDAILVRREDYKRYRDLMFILTGAGYALNILDAYISAHLKDFDMSDDLGMRITPCRLITFENTVYIGSGLTLYLKR